MKKMQMQPLGNAPIEVFAYAGEVIVRHLDGESQDIELSPEEAQQLSLLINLHAGEARAQGEAMGFLRVKYDPQSTQKEGESDD